MGFVVDTLVHCAMCVCFVLFLLSALDIAWESELFLCYNIEHWGERRKHAPNYYYRLHMHTHKRWCHTNKRRHSKWWSTRVMCVVHSFVVLIEPLIGVRFAVTIVPKTWLSYNTPISSFCLFYLFLFFFQSERFGLPFLSGLPVAFFAFLFLYVSLKSLVHSFTIISYFQIDVIKLFIIIFRRLSFVVHDTDNTFFYVIFPPLSMQFMQAGISSFSLRAFCFVFELNWELRSNTLT